MTRPAPTEPMTMRELTTVLIKHHGFHEGLYETALEFKFALGQVGPTHDDLLPGAMIGVSRIGLVPAENPGPAVVDAAEVNPAKKPTKRSSAK